MIITALVGATVASYFIPFVIACVVGGVVAVGTAIAGYYTGRSNPPSESRELERLRKELSARDALVRQSASSLAETTRQDADALLNRAQEQQAHLEVNLVKLDQHVIQIDQTAINLDQSAQVLEKITDNVQLQTEKTSSEMDTLVASIEALNQKMKVTQRTLQETEQLLENTVKKLTTAHNELAQTTEQSHNKMTAVSQQLTNMEALLNNVSVETLHADNLRMTKHIEALEETLKQLSLVFKTTSNTCKDQFDEINTLHEENTRLQNIILELTNVVDKPLSTTSRGPGLFKQY